MKKIIITLFLLLTEGFLCVRISRGLNSDPINNAPILIVRGMRYDIIH